MYFTIKSSEIVYIITQTVFFFNQYSLFRIATKASIAGGAVYVTVDQGVWGSSDQTNALYDKVHCEAQAVF